MAGAERFELSTRGFGGTVETPPPRGGFPVCPRMRGMRKPDAPRIDAFLMMLGNLLALFQIKWSQYSLSISASGMSILTHIILQKNLSKNHRLFAFLSSEVIEEFLWY